MHIGADKEKGYPGHYSRDTVTIHPIKKVSIIWRISPEHTLQSFFLDGKYKTFGGTGKIGFWGP